MLANQLDVLIRHEYNQDRLREAERERLIQEALKARPESHGWHSLLLSWLGSQMVNWGQGLQARYDASARLAANSRSPVIGK
jgi:hypothetical protein